MLKKLSHHKQNICLPSSFFAGIGMSHALGNCAGLCAVRSPEDLRVLTVLSRKKKYIVKSGKLSFFLHLHMAFYF